ncbi:MAG: alpha-amylase family glycosyl hydrolase [Calditrichia bacterium]
MHPTIYSVFLRNFHEKDSVNYLKKYVEKLSELHIDYVWFLPFYPVGKTGRKGTLGSPYSISDYLAFDETYLTDKEFDQLCSTLKLNQMKIMIDIVFHHCSHDHPFIHVDNYIDKGGPSDSAAEIWSDVAKLNIHNEKLQTELMDILRFWLKKGVDGFRCDVASLIPASFWRKCKDFLKNESNANPFILAETVSPDFFSQIFSPQIDYSSEFELKQTFLYTYAYDFYYHWINLLAENIDLKTFCNSFNQYFFYFGFPSKKCFFTENHDTPRGLSFLSMEQWKVWNLFFALQPGAFLLFNGQEWGISEKMDLFNPSPIPWSEKQEEIFAFYKTILNVRHLCLKQTSISSLIPMGKHIIKQIIQSDNEKQLVYYNMGSSGTVISVEENDKPFFNPITNHTAFSHNSKIALAPYSAVLSAS